MKKILVAFCVTLFFAACASTSNPSVSKESSQATEEKTSDKKSENLRSKKDLMGVIGKNTQERLKPLYNNYLRKKPHFAGTITVKYTILANGDVEKAEIVSATTDYPEFEKVVLADVLQWKYPGGDYTKCTITVPLIFSE